MKKFLTVLLVIAVMFTFSFGSAFAATGAEKATALAEAKAHAEKVVNDYYEAAMKEVVKDNLYYTAAKAADIEAAWALIDAKAQVMDEIATEYLAEAEGNFQNYEDTAAAYAHAVFGVAAGQYDEVADVAKLIKEVAGAEAVKNMYEADRAEILSAFDKVDYSVYSATEKNSEGKTYLEAAEKIVADAKESAAELALYKAERYEEQGFASNLVTYAIPALKDYVATYLEAQTYAGTSYETGLYLVKDVPTSDKVEAENLATEATTAAIKAQVAKNVAAYLKANSSAAAKAFVADYSVIYNYLAEQVPGNTKLASDVIAHESMMATVQGSHGELFDAAVKSIESLEEYAAKYAAEKDATGAYVRDAEEVEKVVAKATLGTYADVAGIEVAADKVTTVAKAETEIYGMSVDGDAYDLAFAKEQYKAALANDLEALEVEDNYYALEATKIQANYEAGVAKIEAATTPAKVKAAYEAVKLTKDAKLAADVDKTIDWNNAPAKAAYEAVKAYVTYANTGKTVLNDDYIVTGQEADMMAAIAEIYGEAGARTAAERKAVTIDAATVAAELVTVGELNAAKAAAEAAIKALPTTITEADKDAVVAAKDLADDYADMFGAGTLSNIAKLEAAQTALKTDMVKNFAIAVAKADKKDLAAMKELQAQFDAANELVEDGYLAAPKFDDSVVAKAITDIRDAELAAVKKLINNLPINITEADKAQVEAAREAYDAFVAEWTDYEAPYNAVAKVTNFRELALAEAALGLNAEDPAYSVEALKIKARTDKAKKGSITVRWTVIEGDDSAVEGYEIWKSTKHSKGYKKMITKSADSTWYKNTKGLEAGTRYYYKVRAIAYTEDGVKVKSDFSNKARRIAK